jgi:peptide chain release factor 3
VPTFVNKLDRKARDPFDLLDEIEQSLALDVTPASWPIGMGRDFLGTYNLFADALLLFERGVRHRVTEPVRCSGLDDPQLPRLLPKDALPKLREEVEMAKGLCPPFERASLSRGPSDAGLFRQRAEQFRGARIIGRGRRTGPGAAPAAGRSAADLARGA